MTSFWQEHTVDDSIEEPQAKHNMREGQLGGVLGRDPRLSSFERSGDKQQVHFWLLTCSSMDRINRSNNELGCQNMSEAESKRAAEHKHIAEGRRATLRSLRNRKSLATCGSFIRSCHTTEQNSLRLHTAVTEASSNDGPWAADVNGSLILDEAQGKSCASVLWSGMERHGNSGDGTSRRHNAKADAWDMHPVRSALPMINQASILKARNHGAGYP